MKNLLTLLERFSKSLHKDTLTREAVCEAILHSTGIKLSPDAVTLKDGVLTISASATAKNEMRLKEERIRDELKGAKVAFSRIIYR